MRRVVLSAICLLIPAACGALALSAVGLAHRRLAAERPDVAAGGAEDERSFNGPRKDPHEQRVRVSVLKSFGEQVRFLRWGPNDTAGEVTGVPVVRVKFRWANGATSDMLFTVEDGKQLGVTANNGGDEWVAYEYQMEKEGLRGDRAARRAKGWPKDLAP